VPEVNGLNGSTVLRVPDTVLMRTVRDEVVLLDMAGEEYYGLNAVGACVIRSVKDGADVDAAVAAVVDAFDAPEEQIRADVVALVEELVATGLLVVTPE
jgi:hypothetical protein